MNWKERISRNIVKYVPTRILSIESAMRKKMNKEKLSGELKKESYVPEVFSLEDWRTAIGAATDSNNPDRKLLMDIYKSCELDDHLMTVIENRIKKVQKSQFKLVNEKDERNEEAMKLLRKPFILDFIKYAMESLFTGTKLIELGDLSESLELKEVNKIPETNVLFHQNKIIKDPLNPKEGWQYDTPPFQRMYIQVGKDDELGVMEMLAVAVLFKKKATGSWLDYIEKYGVPPRWVITDREDDERFDELYDMMREMISNHFAVLRGNEKIEIMPTPGTDAHQVFDKFIDRMDNGITKRIAGATGTVDEKSFVGAAKVHQETANDRTFADLLFIEYLINEELLPRLIELSPTYSILQGLRFEWDDAEEMSVQEFIDNICKLSANFEVDTDEITQRTGITILKQKGISEDKDTKPSGGAAEKK